MKVKLGQTFSYLIQNAKRSKIEQMAIKNHFDGNGSTFTVLLGRSNLEPFPFLFLSVKVVLPLYRIPPRLTYSLPYENDPCKCVD